MIRGKQSTAEPAGICLVANDAQLMGHARQLLGGLDAGRVDVFTGPLTECVDRLKAQDHALAVIELRQPHQFDLGALERLAPRGMKLAFPVIVIADGLNEHETRQLVRLGVVDWLPRPAVTQELPDAARRALGAVAHNANGTHANIISVMPAVGGSGASTLSIAALEMLARVKKVPRAECCIVDLNLTSGTIADYLDTPARLDLREIATTPERLDAQLFEVMLSHSNDGFGVLAAIPSLTIDQHIDDKIISRLLDLAVAKFTQIVIDMPSVWMPWSDTILRGSDKFYFVTDLSVTGLRHARRLAEQVSSRTGVPLDGSILVNKVGWFDNAGLTKKDAADVLGSLLGGFIADGGKHVRAAQNQGQLLTSVKSRNPIISGLEKIVFAQ